MKWVHYNINMNISSFQVIAFDELKTDCKHPIEQCDSLNPVSLYIKSIISNTYEKINFTY